jgi:hypothetical protein
MATYKKIGFEDPGVVPGGGGGGSSTPYTLSFTSTDWTIGVTTASISVAQSVHLKGVYPTVEVYEIVTFNLEKVNTEVMLDNTGLVTITVSFTPDLRFSGRMIIT